MRSSTARVRAERNDRQGRELLHQAERHRRHCLAARTSGSVGLELRGGPQTVYGGVGNDVRAQELECASGLPFAAKAAPTGDFDLPCCRYWRIARRLCARAERQRAGDSRAFPGAQSHCGRRRSRCDRLSARSRPRSKGFDPAHGTRLWSITTVSGSTLCRAGR